MWKQQGLERDSEQVPVVTVGASEKRETGPRPQGARPSGGGRRGQWGGALPIRHQGKGQWNLTYRDPVRASTPSGTWACLPGKWGLGAPRSPFTPPCNTCAWVHECVCA